MKKFVFPSLLLLLAGCSFFKVTPKEPPPSKKPPSFDYRPPTEGVTRSNEITFILLNPRYAEDFQSKTLPPYSTLVESMKGDFEEMLVARGYPYKGPYREYDELVYSDKKNADLILEAEVSYEFTGAQSALKKEQKYDVVTKQYHYVYYYDGDVTLSGRIELSASEPFTKTVVWRKSVPLSSETFRLRSYHKYDGIPPDDDPLIWNSIVSVLEEQYIKAMKLSLIHI